MAPLVSPDTPVYVVPAENRIPLSDHLTRMAAIPPSRMFLIKKSLKTYQEHHPDSPVYDASQGDGGASLPGVPVEILEQAARMQIEHGTGYDMPFGTAEYRRAVVEDYWQLDSDLGYGPANVVGTAGGRDALIKAYQAMLALGHGRQGDVLVVSRVPWISYNWGPYDVGANVLLAPGSPEEQWAYSPESLRACVEFAAREGRKVAGVVITCPDNPTGRMMPAEEQAALGHAALEAGAAFVLYDWIYHRVTDQQPADLNAFLRLFSPAERDRLIFLDGLTKSLGASNIRNAHLIASEEVIRFIVARASHSVMPTFYGLAVAIAAYNSGYAHAARTIIEPTNASRRLLKQFLQEHRFRFIIGQGYYAFIHLGEMLRAHGWADSEPLGQYLAEQYGLAVVPGAFFSPFGGEWIRFSYATPPERTLAAAQRLLQAREVSQ
ncbi:MAG: pyridoxal phosphate-dependent aminotransferase [Anaerolineales bacterium]